jgi:hypothetical protein
MVTISFTDLGAHSGRKFRCSAEPDTATAPVQMIKQQTNPIGSCRPWQTRLVRLARGVSGMGWLRWLRTNFAGWRLIPFMLTRTEVGRGLEQRSQMLKFYGHRFAHGQSEQVKSARLGTQITWQLAKFAVDPLVYAAFAVALFVGFPVAYQQLASGRHWPALPLPPVTVDSYIGLMTTVAQAAAAMLALFFTAISVVTSTTYAKITTEVRSLIAEDDLNRRYLSLLAHTAATATAGVGLHALGLGGSSALAAYVVILSAVSLLAFLPLGIRTFALFDPSNLTGYPMRAFAQALRVATHTGRRWLDPAFQNYANRNAEKQLQLLSDLMVFGINENRPRHDTVLPIATSANRVGQFYSTKKLEIPSESFWFTRKPEFKRWQMEGSSMTGIALQTGVAPPPDVVPDHSFVEAQCTEMTVECLRYLFKHNALEDAVKLLIEVTSTAKAYAQQFEQQESIRLVGAVRAVVVERLKATDQELEPLKHLQVVDVLCVAALAPILTIGLSLTDRSIGKLMSVDASLLKLDRRGMYAGHHPRKVLKDAEDLFQRLKFERAVEGAITTQPWYVRQITALAYAEVIRDVIQGFAATVEGEFVSPAAELIAAKRPLWAGVWLQRAIEACHKARDRIDQLEQRYAELKGFHVTELQWYPSGADAALTEIEAARGKIIQMLAKIVPDLCALPSGGTLPDLLGHVRAWLAEELIAMMEQKQEEGFLELFVAYFNASIAVYRHFVEFAQQPGMQDYVRVAIDTMVDVMDVSGMAFLFSELDGTRFEKLVAAVWDLHFKNAADKPGLVRALYGSIDSKLSLPIFSPSAVQRQEWGQRLAAVMADRGVDVDRHFGGPWGHRPKPHPSAVIESVIVSYGYPMDDPHEYFAALYIARREDAKGIDLPRSVSNCIQSINNAREREAQFKDEEKNEPSED